MLNVSESHDYQSFWLSEVAMSIRLNNKVGTPITFNPL
ncbi:MAG: hypothetical protein OJF48_003583 [Afipia sp.]|nr:MAG: hypothetical protein OJF48_003583 [Afipia sp.]